MILKYISFFELSLTFAKQVYKINKIVIHWNESAYDCIMVPWLLAALMKLKVNIVINIYGRTTARSTRPQIICEQHPFQ